MARPVRGCPTARLQQEDADKPERYPQQREQPDTTEDKDIADYDLDVNYEGSEPKVETDVHEQREVDLDAENVKMKCPEVGPSTRG